MAFGALGRDVKISYMPLWMKGISLWLVRLFTSSKTYGPIEFIWTALSMDGVAPAFGKETLRDFFQINAKSA